MRFEGRVKWRWSARRPALALGAVILAMLVMFPHLPLPWYRASEQIAYESAPPESTMPGTDSDNDGLYDNIEKKMGTDPLNPDTDGDTQDDGQEYRYWTTTRTRSTTARAAASRRSNPPPTITTPAPARGTSAPTR